jgi:hypothetical protein
MKRHLILTAWFFATSFGAACFAQQPIGSMQSQDATVRGAVTLNGPTAELRSGAEVTTGANPVIVKLQRGGTLRICPQSSVQLTSSPSGKELLVALNSGALETDYQLAGSADVLMTTDFQLQLAGPGSFHYAVESRGNHLCTKSLAGANASLIVTETMGPGTYQVRPGDRVQFANGSVSNPQEGNCGCPEQAVKSSPPELGFPEQQSQAAAQARTSGETPPAAPPLPEIPQTTSSPEQTITQVNVPLAFSAGPPPEPPPPQPYTEARLAVLPEIAKPAVPQPPPKRNLFQKIGRAFARLFGGRG